MRCFRKLHDISKLDHITNEEARNQIRDAIGFHIDLLTMVRKQKQNKQTNKQTKKKNKTKNKKLWCEKTLLKAQLKELEGIWQVEEEMEKTMSRTGLVLASQNRREGNDEEPIQLSHTSHQRHQRERNTNMK